MLTRRAIPNLLTFARALAVPLCLLLITLDPVTAADSLFWIFLAASVTDFLDGYLARKWNATSAIGALLDPIADKLLVALLLLYLMLTAGLPIFLVAIILLRELFIAGLREFLATKQVTLPVSYGGKIKTMLQMVGISVLLAAPALALPAATSLGTHVLWLSAAFSLASAVQYTKASWKYLR